MKRYEVYIYNEGVAKLRYATDSIDEACDMGYEIEKNSEEKFEGTVIYDRAERKWFGQHEKGTAYILSK